MPDRLPHRFFSVGRISLSGPAGQGTPAYIRKTAGVAQLSHGILEGNMMNCCAKHFGVSQARLRFPSSGPGRILFRRQAEEWAGKAEALQALLGRPRK